MCKCIVAYMIVCYCVSMYRASELFSMFSCVVVYLSMARRCTSCEIVSSRAASVSRTSCHQVFPPSPFSFSGEPCWFLLSF